MKAVLKILAALAAVAGAVYVVATYGDAIVAWAKKVLNSLPKCPCCEGDCTCSDEDVCECDGSCQCSGEEPCECPAEEAPVEEAPAEEAPVVEVPAEEIVADEADFEN